ncbi:hypothetical protein Y032_0004g2234 [Ancylostoma ceylanicum]|uniref:Uncharacterized protein n=1 Tax=Ancylostoma ceylanicum TaxID=53326 RepID=A0A016VW29_9BILA|nr:hypothetical protein Y032_0004g2234 [Ancylostoma ceylanicum]
MLVQRLLPHPVYSRSKKYLSPASTAHLLGLAAPPMHYHTCCDVAQSTRSVAGDKYILERLCIRACLSISGLV